LEITQKLDKLPGIERKSTKKGALGFNELDDVPLGDTQVV